MDIQKQIDYWRKGAEEELEVAELLLEKRRFRHSMFLAHLALEKMLKAHGTRVTRDVPPRIHNLVRLAELAMLKLTVDQLRTLRIMNSYQLEGRYPEEAALEIPEEVARRDFESAKEMLAWLRAQF
jgi:HEPN domain-containing protein